MKKKLLIIGIIILIVVGIGMNLGNSDKEKKTETISSKKINYDSKLTDIKFNDKVNIYLFYGRGCPHCEELFEYLESINDSYSKYYNLYTFEVWYNEDNGKIMDYFLDKFGKKVSSRSVPFLIIGDEAFEGYNTNMNQKIISTIKEKYKNRTSITDYSDVLNI